MTPTGLIITQKGKRIEVNSVKVSQDIKYLNPIKTK